LKCCRLTVVISGHEVTQVIIISCIRMDSEIVHEKPCDDTNLPENSPIDYDKGEISEGNESKSDDLHFTRDITESLEVEGRTEVVDAQNTDKIENSEKDACNEDDFASGAAIAMAALAAAASANTSSPSAAAEAARAMAPNLVKAVTSSRNEDVTVVQLSMVRNFLLKRMMSCRKENPEIGDTGNEPRKYLVEKRLAQGENDIFLQCLLLFQSFRTDSSGDAMDKGAEIDNLDDLNLENSSFVENKVLTASEKVRSMLHMAEEAYDAMEALLPPSLPHLEDEASVISPLDSDIYRDERPLFVPDLLPPCTSIQGDATLQFFLACQGGKDVCDNSDSDQPRGEDSVFDSETNDTSEESVDDINNLSSQKSATSIFSSMFSSMTRTSKNTTIHQGNISLAGVFRKRTRQDGVAVERTVETNSRISMDENLNPGEYSVSIDREMLGLTVENVLERTVIRTVLPGGAAKKAGAKVGSLIVRVGNVETKNLTHFETIDELRQSQRPLRLVLRQLAVESLNLAREEMGRLIRGGGFGAFLPQENVEHMESERMLSFKRNQHGKRTKTEAFSQVLHLRWSRDGAAYTSKKEESLVLISEKLVWILSLLVIGLEREASKPPQSISDGPVDSPSKRSCAHIREDFVEASRSVSKVLWDFASYRLLNDIERAPNDTLLAVTGNRQRRVGPPPITAPGRHAGRIRGQDVSKKGKDFHNLLVRVGDVLQRTRTFLADSTSPPAALLRGEVISFLCGVLDIDSDMELSEEQGGSSSTGVNAAPLNDLGSAGSLLKLIILNCSMMRSRECLSLKADAIILDLEEEHRRRFRSIKRPISAIDIHRFHAGNRFLAVVHRLAASRSVSARVTACSLGPILWGHLDFPHQLQVSKFFFFLRFLLFSLLASSAV
jgi:PDZ domain